MTDWEERRIEPRVPVDTGRIRVTDPQDGRDLGSLANLSSHGLMLNSASPFTEQASYQAELCWLNDDGDEQSIPLGIHALWCSAGPAGSHWTGFAIIDISDTDQVRLDELLVAARA
jgi:hypothetical protein